MKSATVLLVEDDKVLVTIHSRSLRDYGCHVVHAGNGEEALKKAASDFPDVIVLDIGLPKKDGFEVLQELKANEETAQIPVIMYTRLSSREDVKQAFDLGAAAYLIKSHHSPEELAEQVLRFAQESSR